MKLGIISDTHGLVDAKVFEVFEGVDAIVHGGDIGGGEVITELEAIAPVIACSGNVDGFEESGFPRRAVREFGGLKIGATHIGWDNGALVPAVEEWIRAEQFDLFVFGHSHWPRIAWCGKTLVINPGSAGPKRFQLPRAIATVSLSDGALTAGLVAFG